MHFTLFLPILAATAYAVPVENIEKRAACSSYTIINTRGTTEKQGESAGFRIMNMVILSAVTGGTIYSTVYPAGVDQNSAPGTDDIINQVRTGLQKNPNQCFILEGYSQGAAATVIALPSLTGASFDAVRGVFLIGDPLHKSGLACNIDNNGDTTTKNVNGLGTIFNANSIPNEWISKTKDVCIYGDGVCDTTHGLGVNKQHLSYPTDLATQKLGANFIVQQLKA